MVDTEESFLLVAVTRANQIWRGTAASERPHLQRSASSRICMAVLAALMALDNGGNLWSVTPASVHMAASPVAGRSTALSPAPVSAPLILPSRTGTKSLFITESRTGHAARAELETPGLPMFSHAD